MPFAIMASFFKNLLDTVETGKSQVCNKKEHKIFSCTPFFIAETGFEPVLDHLGIQVARSPALRFVGALPIPRLQRLPLPATGSGRPRSLGNPQVTGLQ